MLRAALMGSLPADHQHPLMILIELNFVAHCALRAEPNNFLLDVRGQSPSLRLGNWQGVDLTRAQPLKLSWTTGIGTFPQPWNPHIHIN
jgi:hypothetical protein